MNWYGQYRSIAIQKVFGFAFNNSVIQAFQNKILNIIVTPYDGHKK